MNFLIILKKTFLILINPRYFSLVKRHHCIKFLFHFRVLKGRKIITVNVAGKDNTFFLKRFIHYIFQFIPNPYPFPEFETSLGPYHRKPRAIVGYCSAETRHELIVMSPLGLFYLIVFCYTSVCFDTKQSFIFIAKGKQCSDGTRLQKDVSVSTQSLAGGLPNGRFDKRRETLIKIFILREPPPPIFSRKSVLAINQNNPRPS